MSLQSFFYDQQIRRYIIQFIRMISNFQVEFGKNSQGITALQRVPVIYGDSSRQAATIIKQNSENYLNAVPAMAVYVSGLTYDRARLQNPTYIGKMNLRERYFDPQTGNYTTTEGDVFSVERLMPVPYKLTLKVDIWTSNTEQKLQVLEQLCTLFNPALEIQSTDNYIDWSSLTYVLLNDVTWSSRTIPIGTETPIDVATLTFEMPIFINAPALIKKFGVIQKIIASIFDADGNIDEAIYSDSNLMSRQHFTPLQYGVILIGNQLSLVKYNENVIEYFGENIIKKLATAANANVRIHLDNTTNVEPGMTVAAVRVTGPGTISVSANSNIVTGIGTFFQSNLSVNTSLYTASVSSGNVFIGNISSITSNTQLTLSSVATTAVSNIFYTYKEPLYQSSIRVLSVNGDVVTTNKLITAQQNDLISFHRLTTDQDAVRDQWRNLINVYGNLSNGTSQIKLEMPDGNELVGTVAYNPQDASTLIYNIDIDTIPSNTLAPVNAIIDPTNERPDRDLQSMQNGTRYLIVKNYSTPEVEQPIYNWKGVDNTPLVANANDIIQFNGQHWFVAFNSAIVPTTQYMTNLTTGVQYKWDGSSWTKSYQGFYEAGKWELIL